MTYFLKIYHYVAIEKVLEKLTMPSFFYQDFAQLASTTV